MNLLPCGGAKALTIVTECTGRVGCRNESRLARPKPACGRRQISPAKHGH